MTVLRVAPRPVPGELFASWVGRLACLYDAPPIALWQELTDSDHTRSRPGTDAPTTDELARIAAAARLDVGVLAATTVDVMLPAAPETWLRARGPILSDDVRWCDACLHDDRRRGRVPHLRRLWAAACVAVCPRHQLPLTDLCPVCLGRIRPRFRWAHTHPILVCEDCGADLVGSKKTLPVLVGGLLAADCPPEAIAAVSRLQTRLLRILQAYRPAHEWSNNAIPVWLINETEVLAGHLLVRLGIVRLSGRVGFTADRCRFNKLNAKRTFAVLAAVAALLAWPAAESEKELERDIREQCGLCPEPVNLVRLWAQPGTFSDDVLRFNRRH